MCPGDPVTQQERPCAKAGVCSTGQHRSICETDGDVCAFFARDYLAEFGDLHVLPLSPPPGKTKFSPSLETQSTFPGTATIN